MFGTEASHRFTYGFFPHSIHIASPFSVHDLYRQRRRWLWGSLKSLPLLSRSERAFILARLYCGCMAIPSIILSAYSAYAGLRWPLPLQIVFSGGTVVFVGYYLLGGWLNTHSPKRMVQTLLLFLPAAVLEAPVLIYSLLKRPTTFEVIRKE